VSKRVGGNNDTIHNQRGIMKRKLTLEYWKDADWYVGKLREVPGVFSQGETLKALEDNIKDAYTLMINEFSSPESSHVHRKEIAIQV
jgi:predicted RNase H-like HicB family nuclease